MLPTALSPARRCATAEPAWLLLGAIVLTAVALFGLWRDRTGPPSPLRFATLWLALPVAAILTGVLGAQVQRPLRHDLAAGVDPDLEHRLGKVGTGADSGQGRPAAGRRSSIARGWSRCSAPAFSTPISTGLPTRPLRKDQWRELSAFLRPRIAEHEAIVLVSGHAWPVWAYYAPDLPVIRLPAIETLDVDAVLDFPETAGPAQAALGPLGRAAGRLAGRLAGRCRRPDRRGAGTTGDCRSRRRGVCPLWGLNLRRFPSSRLTGLPTPHPSRHRSP